MTQGYRRAAMIAATILMSCVGGAGLAAAEGAPVPPPAKLAMDPVSLPAALFAVPTADPPAPARVAPTPPASATYSAALLNTKPRKRSRTGAWLAPGTRETADVSTPAHGSSERERAVVVRIKLPF